ncbi:MAG: fluoride efflux transporter CrcB [Gammaproteobacteria bacterium]
MLNILCIAIGGGTGAVLRFCLSDWLALILGRNFPYGTLAANIIGSFLIGVLFVCLHKWDAPVYWRLGLMVGLLGGFTTFSAFSIETVMLIEAGKYIKALINVLASVSVCLAACWAGLLTARQL